MLNLLETSSSNQINTRFNSHSLNDMSFLCGHFNRSLKLLVCHPMRTIIILQSAWVNSSLPSRGSNKKAELHFPFCISPKTGGLALLWVSLSAQTLSHFVTKKRGLSVGQFGCHNTVPGSWLWPRFSSYLHSCPKKFSFGSWRTKEAFGISKKSRGKLLLRTTACQNVLEVDCGSPTLEEITEKGNESIYIPVCWFILEKEKYTHIVQI